MQTQADPTLRDCGPEGCEIDWLTSKRHEVELDTRAFLDYAMAQGWGDGLPLIPPREALVRGHIAASGHYPDEIVALLPPLKAECTIEKLAINAVMAGAPAESMPLLIAALEAMAESKFELASLNATTGSVVPALVVNGPIRNQLDIPYQNGCLGGVAGPAPAIGRALRLVMRNVAGQVVGLTSQTTFGTPGRFCGIVFGEWEERSPWAPLAERIAGIKGNAVTAYGAMGTTNICDMIANTGEQFCEYLGKSLGAFGANGFLPSSPYSEALLAINPVWAEIIARDIPNFDDVQHLIWEHTGHHIDEFPKGYQDPIVACGRVHANGRFYLTREPKDVFVMVAGGMGSLHAAFLPSWGTCLTTTKPISIPA